MNFLVQDPFELLLLQINTPFAINNHITYYWLLCKSILTRCLKVRVCKDEYLPSLWPLLSHNLSLRRLFCSFSRILAKLINYLCHHVQGFTKRACACVLGANVKTFVAICKQPNTTVDILSNNSRSYTIAIIAFNLEAYRCHSEIK